MGNGRPQRHVQREGLGRRCEPQKRSEPAPFGLDRRIPWTTSKIAGAPEPPDPFTTAPAYANLKFDRPLHIEISPDGKRWFVCEHFGKIYSIPTAGDTAKP